ncbi:DUF1156 domain-containing protein [Halobaculum lipolyticum]|uniref:DUF1156 domain-containing protein n=1 Tax=Halobaculum lipolyticum TaxID=3032001 RepID=A0ABD5WFT1_9EURY
MTGNSEMSDDSSDRKELPIERGFPIERVNEIASKEGRAKRHYRPIYTMHKWWARRLGCVFRAISLYTLLDTPEAVSVRQPGEDMSLGDFDGGGENVPELIGNVTLTDRDALWELYPKDVRVDDKNVLDPFMGGGTSLVETSRFGVESTGYDLNSVAWFVTKKQLESGRTDPEDLTAAYQRIESAVAEELTKYYRTQCPNGDHDADIVYNFWVKELDCVSCGETTPLFGDYRVAKGRYDNSDQYNVFCPDCESVILVDDWRSECTCSECSHVFTPEDGTASRGDYTCKSCGQKYRITDAIQEQGGFDLRLYALEYYCEICDHHGRPRNLVKGYKTAESVDIQLYQKAVDEWNNSAELHEYVPSQELPPGHLISERNPVFDHGYSKWTDMFNERQLLCLSKILREIESIENENVREYLLMAFSDSLRTNTMMCSYQFSANKSNHIFKTNSFDPPLRPTEGNVWGTKYGMGTFQSIWDMILSGVQYGNHPTERYIEDGETIESEPFAQPIGENASIHQGDMRTMGAQDEYDAVITDPPYYDNIMYSESADFFYVWQRILLQDRYDCFTDEKTKRAESIVTNPFLEKTAEDFENEIGDAFKVIHRALKQNGVLTFTYHHSDSESWGELLESLCDAGFEVTATYPVNADMQKFIGGESVEFDIIIVARPSEPREMVSWANLRREIYRTAQETRERLEQTEDLSNGDIGVIEMGECFHEYSKYHGNVQRGGEIMNAKEVVSEIYGIIQRDSSIGEIEVFLRLLEVETPTYDDLSKLTRGNNADPEKMEKRKLYRIDDGKFTLGTWEDDQRLAYIRERVNGDGDNNLDPLDKAQFLRYRYEVGKSIQNYLSKWNSSNELYELCEGLADVTGDEVYLRIVSGDETIRSFE